MKFSILSQIVDYLHDHHENDTDDYRNDFATDHSEVEDPVGGEDGITTYDRYNLDPDAQ